MIEPVRRSYPAARTHSGAPLRLGLVGGAVAGVETQYRNLLHAVQDNKDVNPIAVPVQPYQQDSLERLLPFLPGSVRGTLRSCLATVPLFRTTVDAVWTQIDLPLLPWLLTARPQGIPVIYTADSTPRLLRGFGAHYGYWGGRSPHKAHMRDLLHAACLRRATMINPWTDWAANSMRDHYGVPEDRILVLPPGVDTGFWSPIRRPLRTPVRAIFVGGDFVRKGGDLLLTVFRARFRGRVQLDLVTRTEVPREEGVTVHTGISLNDPRLRKLYHDADFLVIPTRADCFSMSGVEAMSTGLPVITCPVGGVAELLSHGREGFLVPPDDGQGLARAMEALIDDPDRRWRMGMAARSSTEARYDARKNASRLLGLLAETLPG